MNKTKFVVWTIVVAALYATLTLLLLPFSFSYIQVRVADALMVMPFFLGPAGALGLFFGCLIANVFSPIGVIDVIFGSLANLIAGILTWKLNKGSALLAATWPVIIVTLIVGSYLSWFYAVPLWASYVGVCVGEAISCYVIGVPLLKALQKRVPSSVWKF